MTGVTKNILVTAIGSMAAGIVLERLRSATPAALIGCDIHPAEYLHLARLLDYFYTVPHAHEKAAYIEAITKIIREHHVGVIIPLTDLEADILRVADIVPNDVVVTLPGRQIYTLLRDKSLWPRELAGLCDMIPTTKLDRDFGTPRFPAVLKPKNGRSKEGFYLLENQVDLAYYRARIDSSAYILQPYIDGAVISIDVIRDSSRNETIALCREELVRTANGAGMTVRIFRSSYLENVVRDIAEHIDLNGYSNFEFMYAEGVYRLMDINPRFSAGIGFSLTAGYDFVANLINLTVNKGKLTPLTDVGEGIIARNINSFIWN